DRARAVGAAVVDDPVVGDPHVLAAQRVRQRRRQAGRAEPDRAAIRAAVAADHVIGDLQVVRAAVDINAAALGRERSGAARDLDAEDLGDIGRVVELIAALDGEAVDRRLEAGAAEALAGLLQYIHHLAVVDVLVAGPGEAVQQVEPGRLARRVGAEAGAVDHRAEDAGIVGVHAARPDDLQLDRRVDDDVLVVAAVRVIGCGRAGEDDHQCRAGVVGRLDRVLDRVVVPVRSRYRLCRIDGEDGWVIGVGPASANHMEGQAIDGLLAVGGLDRQLVCPSRRSIRNGDHDCTVVPARGRNRYAVERDGAAALAGAKAQAADRYHAIRRAVAGADVWFRYREQLGRGRVERALRRLAEQRARALDRHADLGRRVVGRDHLPGPDLEAGRDRAE